MTSSAPGPEDPAADQTLAQSMALLQARIADVRTTYGSHPGLAALVADLENAHEELRVADEEVRVQQEQVEMLQAARLSESWARERLVSILPAPVVVTDGAGLIRTANAAASMLSGIRIDRLLGKPLFSFVDPEVRPDLRRMLSETLHSDGTMLRTTVRLQPRHGDSYPADVAASIQREGESGTPVVTWVILPTTWAPHERRRDESTKNLAHTLVELTQLPLASHAPQEVLTRVAQTCSHAFDGDVAVSVVLGDPAQPDLVASGNHRAQELDGAQMTAGEGPSGLAWADGHTVISPDLQGDQRWMRLHDRLAQLEDRSGISAIAVPVDRSGVPAGVLTIYGHRHEVASPGSVTAAELLAEAVGSIVAEADVKSDLEALATQLQQALESRSTIDQAKGMVMAAQGCSPQEAFELLVSVSQSSNVKLRDLAARMVHDATHQDVGRDV